MTATVGAAVSEVARKVLEEKGPTNFTGYEHLVGVARIVAIADGPAALTVADEHLATALTHRVLAALRPQPGAGPTGASMEKGRVMLAAVQGEPHDVRVVQSGGSGIME